MPTISPASPHRTYSSWRVIDRAKTRFPETTLVQDGAPLAVLVIPDRPAYRVQAEKIRQAVQARTGVLLPLQTDQELDPWQPAARPQVILGNLMDNRLAAPLYARRYIAADAHYPGPGGHVLHTVHDPWGTGHNVIFAGGSDVTGVSAAVTRLIQTLAGDAARLWLPPLLEVTLAPDVLAAHPELALEPDDALLDERMAAARQMLETGAHGGITDPISHAGFYYHLTGKIGWAELFKRLVFLMYEDFQKGREQYGGPWGMDADFRLPLLMPAWDLVEEAPIFSDEERLQITHIFGQFVEDAVPHAADAVKHRRTRHNHWTFAALGLLFSAQYFGKYYGVREADDWLYVADECFVPQCHSARSHENSNGYQWLTLSHALTYALARPYPAFFDEGHVRTICDLALVSLDNLGWQASYGDTNNIDGWGTEFPILAAAAWYYGDGRYAWTLQRTAYDPGFGIGVRGLGAYRADVEPVEPSELTGVVWLPLDRTFYESFDGDTVLPWAAAYDKVAFRRDFAPQSEYLLLDGMAVGGHKHYNCNALIRLTALDRLWLADGDYYCSAPTFHNGVLPLAGGRTSQMPPFTWRELTADLSQSGFSRTTVKDYGQSDWERNILWRKGKYFLVADVMRARADESYDFRAQWRVLGDVALHGPRLEVRQQDRRLDITNLDGASLRLAVDTYTTAHWHKYPHAEPVVHILQQNRSGPLRTGEADVFLNLLHARWEQDAPLAARRVDAGSILVQEPEGVVWLGTRTGDAAHAPCQTDAELWVVSADELSLVHATTFGCGAPLLRAEYPVDLALDLSSGQAVINAARATLLTFSGVEASHLSVDGMRRALRRSEDTATFSVPPGRHRFVLELDRPLALREAIQTALTGAWRAAAPPAAAATAETRPVTPPLWQVTGVRFTALSPVAGSEPSLVVAGAENGEVRLLTSDGQTCWQQQVEGTITAVASARWGDAPVVVAGSDASTVTAFNLDGERLWQFQVPFYKRSGIIRVLLAADLNGDGQDEIIAGAENWHYYVLDQQGSKLWYFESVHASTAGGVADIDQDGHLELIAATEYYWWFGVSHEGQKKWQHNTILGPGVNHVATARQADGTHLVAFGCRDGTVQVVDAQGTLRSVLPTADSITGLAAADVDGDGAQEFLVASAIQNVYALKGDGALAWRRGTNTPPAHLRVDPNGAAPVTLVAGCDGHLQWLDHTGQPIGEAWMGESATALTLIPYNDGSLVVAALPQRGLCAWRGV